MPATLKHNSFGKQIADLAAPEDDPVYVELHGLFIRKILYDYETRATTKIYRISAIQFVRSFTSTRHSCWEATCEPVVRDPQTGNFGVPHDVKVADTNVTLTHALQGYCLAEYPNGIDADPTYFPWVQQYIDHFRNVIEPKFPSIMLYKAPAVDLPSTKDLPSSHKKRKAATKKDSPSTRRTRPRRTTNVPVDPA